MNLDNLKSAWNAEKTDDVRVPSKIEQLKKAQHPLDSLKRKMKNEWYIQLFAILFLGLVPQLYDIHSSLYVIYYVAYAMLVVISGYYFNLFRNFYVQINHYTADTKDSLTEIYYEFRLNIERYHSFGFLLLPFVLTWLGTYLYSRLMEEGKGFSSLSQNTKYYLIIGTLLISLLFIVAILGWTKYYYGKYAKQLREILDELREEN
ncbi:hypothetical protein [Gynurincola endophyticus]|uniref:hypothetical protein n=1 Tax=Gynurincola endophyticus TaxID=2479004 RepID=UPI000F8C9677|nr:hypothetical protein [Gynurincola endophyticus]